MFDLGDRVVIDHPGSPLHGATAVIAAAGLAVSRRCPAGDHKPEVKVAFFEDDLDECVREQNRFLAKAKTLVTNDLMDELWRATRNHYSMRGPHEGYAVILEELDELWIEVKSRNYDKNKARKEALQVAAMAVRFIIDVTDT